MVLKSIRHPLSCGITRIVSSDGCSSLLRVLGLNMRILNTARSLVFVDIIFIAVVVSKLLIFNMVLPISLGVNVLSFCDMIKSCEDISMDFVRLEIAMIIPCDEYGIHWRVPL